MPLYGLLRNFRCEYLNTEDDIRGTTVYGRDDEILGKIEDVVFDHAGVLKYVVVDRGASSSHRKFLVPSHRLHASATHGPDLWVNLDRQQIEGFPLYQEADLASEQSWRDYLRRLDQAWHSGPVQRE